MKKEIRVISEERAFDSYFKVDKAVVGEKQEDGSEITYNRFKLTRPDAVAILVFNEDTKKVILVKQFRYPIVHKTPENIYEVVAGKIDGNQTAKEAAVREIHEEIGYKISEDRLGNGIEIFASAGYSSEKISIYLAIVNNSDKDENAGGGLATEHENIEIIEMNLSEFMKKIQLNEIKDAKTIIASTLIKI